MQENAELLQAIQRMQREIDVLKTMETPRAWYYLSAPLTSTSWDGDARSTTARTLIDLSAVFGAPAGIKAILVKVTIRDSGSAGGDYSFNLTPTSGAGEIAFTSRCSGLPNDSFTTEAGIVPCDANGDVYYQIAASGASTMDVTMQIWGYYL